MKITLDYQGVDWWNRPIFKVSGLHIDYDIFVGSTNHLFNGTDPREKVIEFFENNPRELEIMGTEFGCEPHGGSINPNLEIIFKK